MQNRVLSFLIFGFLILVPVLVSVPASVTPQIVQGRNAPAERSAANALPPIKIAVVVDKTLSTLDNGIPQLQLADFEPLIELLSNRGGELAVGVISPMSNEPLCRWYFSLPIPLPVDSSAFETNLFRVGQARIRYERAMESYDSLEAERRCALDEVAEVMRPRLDTLLSVPPAAMRSDVVSIVRHVDETLSEPDTEWKVAPLKYAIFCTDGEHTYGRTAPLSMTSNAKILTVSGGTLGILAPLDPIEFENPQAAIRFIVADAARSAAR